MRNRNPLQFTSAAALMMLLAVAAAPALAQQDIDETRAMDADGTVVISNVSGTVTVKGWDREQVKITGTLAPEVEKLEIEGDEQRLEITVKIPKRVKEMEPTILEINLPRGCDVEVNTVSADIDVDDVRGKLELQSVSGDITARGEPEKVEAESVSGELELLVTTKRVSAHSVSGDIRMPNVSGDVAVETVSGDIDVGDGAFERFEANSVSGDIEFEGDLQGDASLSFNSHSGDVTLVLPAGIGADFEINTFSGDITNDFGKKAKRTSKYAPGKQLHFEVGSGGADIEINTFSGDVTLRKR